jgi:hypothetical protein
MSEPRKRDPKVWDVHVWQEGTKLTDGEYYLNEAASRVVVKNGRITMDLVLEKKSTRRVREEKE